MASIEATRAPRGSPLYDPRVRSVAYQFLLVAGLAALVYWMASNAAENLRQQHIASGFDFFKATANFDINQTLISYSAASTYFRAFLVGLLNTLLVSGIGIVLATILGFIVGIARLSTNWVVAKLAKVYVESIRNVPLLLQLYFWYHAVLKPLPEPKDSIAMAGIVLGVPSPTMMLAVLVLGAAAYGVIWSGRTYGRTPAWIAGSRVAAGITAFAAIVVLARWSGLFTPTEQGIVFLNKRGLYLPETIWGDGAPYVIAAFLLGIVGAVAFRWWARTVQMKTGEQYPVGLVSVALIVVLPALVWIGLSIFGTNPITFVLPKQGRFNLAGGVQVFPEFVALLIGLVMYTAAFIAEVVRAGVLAVSKGQTEAARSLGLRGGPALRLVVVPQAMRLITPLLTNQYLNVTKNSTLAVAIGYPDLVQIFAGTVLNQTNQALEVIAITMAVYLVISLVTSIAMNVYNRRVAIVER